ncbi:MAG TPA: DUF302 domain-containing protein [Acidimicrobiia bacterium]|nr:DUF302 domain-containing protein [Acidimicrobiia bacterium]
MTTHRYGFGIETTLSPEEAETRMRSALADEGFGILTEIDVAATLKNKLDVTFKPYRILGACNPQLAHQALASEQSIGLLLPCNVIVYETDEGSAIEVLEPNLMAELTTNTDLEELARDARARLERALAAVAN